MGLISICGQLTLYQSVLVTVVSDDSLRISQHISGFPVVSPSTLRHSLLKKKPLRELKITPYWMQVKSLIFSYEGEYIILFCFGLIFLNNVQNCKITNVCETMNNALCTVQSFAVLVLSHFHSWLMK